MAECLRRCSECARCRTVSFSFADRDCSWYHWCHRGRYADSRLQAQWTRQHGGGAAAAALVLDGAFLELWESGWDYRTVRVLPGAVLSTGTTPRT